MTSIELSERQQSIQDNEDIERSIKEIVKFCMTSEKINITFNDNNTQKTLEQVREITNKQRLLSYDLHRLHLKKDNLTEEQVKKLKRTQEIYNKSIAKLLAKLKQYEKLDEGFRTILGLGIIQAMEEMNIEEVCRYDDMNDSSQIVDNCNPKDDEYICVCGKPDLKNLMICSHKNLEYENFIIGSTCCQHFEIFAMLQACEETKREFTKVSDYVTKYKYKLTNKPCRGCGEYKVSKTIGKIPYKNIYCKDCIEVKGGIVKVKCDNCPFNFKYKAGVSRCGLCRVKPDRIANFNYSF